MGPSRSPARLRLRALAQRRSPSHARGTPFEGSTILRERGYPEEVIHAILGHAHYSGIERSSRLDHALFACDELAVFLTACALIKPSKSIHEVEAPSVKKKLKDKAFARGVNRDDINKGAEELGVPLEEHISFCIEALRGIAVDLSHWTENTNARRNFHTQRWRRTFPLRSLCYNLAISMDRVGEVLGKIVRRMDRPEATLAWLTGSWTAIVGKTLAAHTRPIRCQNGCLEVAADGKGWRKQLESMKREFCSRVNQAWGGNLIFVKLNSWRRGRARNAFRANSGQRAHAHSSAGRKG